MIEVTVFEPNGNSIWFKNCHHDHIPFTVKGNIVFSVYRRDEFHRTDTFDAIIAILVKCLQVSRYIVLAIFIILSVGMC